MGLSASSGSYEKIEKQRERKSSPASKATQSKSTSAYSASQPKQAANSQSQAKTQSKPAGASSSEVHTHHAPWPKKLRAFGKHLLHGDLPLQNETTFFILVNVLDIFMNLCPTPLRRHRDQSCSRFLFETVECPRARGFQNVRGRGDLYPIANRGPSSSPPSQAIADHRDDHRCCGGSLQWMALGLSRAIGHHVVFASLSHSLDCR